ncbi:hypothetical protein OUZ56_009668 [Daphnia magna]|uniref:Chromo domain-containing protein n=1 Tax=Daphnia magna TaxID=35525 RepID=A0ABR0AGM1_9CRUS|nr:hypothetical protein OUZ56_009668 [Daphnia magna]
MVITFDFALGGGRRIGVLYRNEEGLLRGWYLIKFKGYPDTDNQWIPAKLTNCRTLIREFNKKKIMNNVLTPPQSNSDGIVELFEDVVVVWLIEGKAWVWMVV